MPKSLVVKCLFFLTTSMVLSFFVLYSRNVYINQDAEVREIEVSITDQGFNPEIIVITTGSRVIWTNKGENEHWPASNYHPTHTLYPEDGGCIGSKFDACRGLKKGERYSFTFTHAGRWSVHDHLFPGITMLVEVGNKPVQKYGTLEKEMPEEFHSQTVDKQLKIIKKLAEDSPEMAWNYIKRIFIINGQVVGNAHEFAHIIGGVIYKKYGLSGIKICDESFAFGCYHGISERMLLEKGPDIIPEIQTSCLKEFPPDVTQNYTGCIHGTGHGLLGWAGLNVQKALERCNGFDIKYRSFCYDGVFMENSTAAPKNIFDQKSPWRFCEELSKQYYHSCARYQSQIFLKNVGEDYIKVGTYCALSAIPELRDTCFQSFGFYVAQSVKSNPKKIQEICASFPGIQGKSLCIIGSAQELIFQKYEGGTIAAQELCKGLTSEWIKDCVDKINRLLNL